MFPESSFWKNLPTEVWFPSLMACALPHNVGQFLELFLSGAEEASEKLLPEGALLESRKHKENNKMSSCIPPLVCHFDFRCKLPSFPHGTAT